MRIAQQRLVFMGLVALDEAIERACDEPICPSRALRATIAMLYAFSDGRRASFDRFLAACQMPNGEGHREHRMRHDRTSALSGAFNGICLALGERRSIALGDDLHRARRAPLPQAEAWQRHHPQPRTEWERERKRFAEAMRIAAEGDRGLGISSGTPQDCVRESV